ncbi:MAG: cyanophycinase [Actinobacteria bacterium]|nr:cyanophycinase [Actinomycetota bacterium]
MAGQNRGGSPPTSAPSGERGPVMVIGGAEDKFRDRVILARFTELAGAPGGHVSVISTASELGEAATEFYRELFVSMGIASVSGLRPLTREEANRDDHAAALQGVTGIFLTGGNQLRLSSVVGGTALGRAVVAAHAGGAVVAGTSAGASAVSSHMVAFGSSGATPKHRMVHMSAGLGLLSNVVIDQHFEQRTRLGRLLAVVAQSPSLVGLGLDEDTAAVVHADDTLEVIGRGSVTVVDGSRMVTDAFRTKGYRPMMVSGAVLHSLPAGYRFDLRTRELLTVPDPNAERAARVAGPASKRLRTMARRVASEGADDRAETRRRSREDREASS